MNKASLLFVTLAVAAASPVMAFEDHHHHATTQPHPLTLDQGRQWATDEPLRAGMDRIRAAMAERLERIHQDELTADQYRTLSAEIQQHVGAIVAQCKLEPRADAMLHIVIADLLAGAGAMQGKGDAVPIAGAHRVVEALNAYGEHFTHPGWRPLP